MVAGSSSEPLRQSFAHQIIRASAGTGKTFALSNRYLKLLAAGAECQSILATTFSRKGAGEILDRIVGRLSDAALDPVAAQRLADELEIAMDRSRAAEILHGLLQNLHRLEVSTLDSFFNRVAKAFSLELGLPPTWEIVEEQQIAQMEDQAIQQVLQDDSVKTVLHMLSKGEATRRVASMIRDVVRHVYGVFRESGPAPWSQLEPIGRRLQDDQVALLVDEIQSIQMPNKLLTKHWETVKEATASDDWTAFVKNRSFQNYLDGNPRYSRSKLPPAVLSIYEKLVPHCQALVSQQLVDRNVATRDLLTAFGSLMEESKSQTGFLRFDDVTERLQDFVQMWDTERFSFRLDHQIQHLLLDEFQDTSPGQWNVIEPFARRVVSGADGHRSFFCVGDMKQAIFGWRGGVAEIFDLVDQTLPNLSKSTLAKSYRSSPEVVNLVNGIFGNVDQYSCDDPLIDEAIQQWPAWFSEHSTARTELDGYVAIELASDCDAATKKRMERKDAARNENVMDATIKTVRRLVREMPEHTSIGVLVRTNREIGELIFRLRQKGVEVSEEGGSGLTDSAAVELVLSALQLADHPADGLARYHLSHSPLATVFGIEPETDINREQNFVAAQVGASRIRARLVDEGYGAVVESLARQLVQQATEREVNRLQQLVRVAYDHSTGVTLPLRPSKFVQFVRDEVKVSGESSARVRVMTIHKSKGLEFDAVVLPFRLTSEGWAGQTPNVVVGRESPTAPITIASQYAGAEQRKLLPVEFQQLFEADRQANVRESMCVLYVALTRAVHAVHMILSFGAKPNHKSPAGILLSTLCPEAPREEGLLYESGNRNWFEGQAKPEEVADDLRLKEFYMPEHYRLKSGAVARDIRSGRGLPALAPSSLAGVDQVQLSELFEARADRSAITRGKMIHGCFEKLHWLDDELPQLASLEAYLRQLDATVADPAQYVAEFYDYVKQPGLQKLFSRLSYQASYLPDLAPADEPSHEAMRLEVDTERGFAVQASGGFSRGVIDRLVRVYRGDQLVAADVIDIKTDHLVSGSLHEKVGQYRSQLQAYREAASVFLRLPLERIASRLVFVQSGQIVNVDVVEGAAPRSSRSAVTGRTHQKRGPVRQPHLNRTHSDSPKETSPQDSRQPKGSVPSKPKQIQKTLWDT